MYSPYQDKWIGGIIYAKTRMKTSIRYVREKDREKRERMRERERDVKGRGIERERERE